MSSEQNALLKAAIEDVRDLHAILDKLVMLRKSLNLTQKEVGLQMGIKQSAVSTLESEESNPQVETVQRYARALGAKLKLDLDLFSEWEADAKSFNVTYTGQVDLVANLNRELTWNG